MYEKASDGKPILILELLSAARAILAVGAGAPNNKTKTKMQSFMMNSLRDRGLRGIFVPQSPGISQGGGLGNIFQSKEFNGVFAKKLFFLAEG